MNAKEIKSHLKDAREAIRVKDFEGASGHCKAILEKEEGNYNALVFLGVAAEGLEKFEDALNAYRKATAECPDQVLAWQGLASLLDKYPNLMILKERIAVYEKLKSFTAGAEGKRVSYLHKLVALYLELGTKDKAYEILEELLKVEKEGDGRVSTCKAMVDLLTSQKLSQDKDKNGKYHDCLDELLKNSDLNGDDVERYTRLSLFSASKTSNSQSWVDLMQRFPKAVPPLEFGLSAQLELVIGNNENKKDSLNALLSISQDLKSLCPESELVKTTEGVLALYQGNYTQAKDLLVGVDDKILTARYFLCEAYLKLHDFSKCLTVCSAGVGMCADPKSLVSGNSQHVEDMFKLMLAEAHRQLGSEVDQEASLKILEELEGKGHKKATVIKSHLFLDQNRLDDAQSCIQSIGEDNVEVRMVDAIVNVIRKQHSHALDIVKNILIDDPDHALATLNKGICLWELRNSPEIENVKQQCFTSLLKAAKLDPYNFKSFLYLGYFYDQIQKDANKASRCYRKSYDLNPLSEDAGRCYVDSLLDQGDQSHAVDVLKAVTTKAPAGKVKWAWLRLGLYQMKHEDPSTAIMSLQAALRADPNDTHVWECLSEAYLHRGSLTAALKAFTKASELNPESTYCLYQIANIKQTLGLLPEAVSEYRQALGKENNYVAALKGLGESVILLAKQHLQQCLEGLAQDNIEEAISVLTRAASAKPEFSCLWKLMGDACTLVFCLAADSYRVPSKLVDKGSDREMMTDVTKAQLLHIGGRCYSQAVKIMPENASLWHNLGNNLYRQCCLEHKQGVPLSATAKELLHRARKALENALKLDQNNWRHWNALGVVACFKGDPKLAFAQHCFIKSAECETNNVVAWSNLGVLYLSQGDIRLAHDMFKVAQRLDPTYMVGWLGQAFVAETVGHEEALDLFRHTTELGSHLESELGYGHHILEMLKDKTKQDIELFQYCIHRMAAIPAASDALIKYTARVQTDPVAYNMLGLILEHQNLMRPSVDAFSRALKLLEGTGNTAMECQVRMNYARALCTSGLYKESLEQFQQIESELTLDHLLMFALTAYKEGNYIDSFKLYKVALEQLPDDDENLKSQVFAALAMVAFKVDDPDEAKTQLFNGFQTDSPSLQGLLAMCALGLHQRDMTLAGAALDELNKRPDGKDVVDKIAVVTLYKHFLEGSASDGETFVRDMIQTHPKSASKLCTILASFLLSKKSPNRSNDVLDCIKDVHKETGTPTTTEVVIKTLAQLQAGMHHRHSNDLNALKSAQRAFHQNPGDVAATAALACALHTEGVLGKRCGHDNTFFFNIEKAFLQVLGSMDNNINKSDVLTWYAKQLVVSCIEAGDETEARKYLDMLNEEDSSAAFVEAVRLFLYATPIAEWSEKETMLAIQIVCAVLADEESELSVVETILKKIVEKPEGNQEQLPTSQLLELWTHTARKGIQKKTKGAKELERLFCDALKISREKEIKSPVLSIVQGIRHFKTDKKGAKHHFATVLDQSAGRADTDNCKGVARRGLIALLWDSTKSSDQELIQALVEDAKSENDVTTLQFYESLEEKK